MSDNDSMSRYSRALIDPVDPNGMRYCVCGGGLLWRGEACRPGVRMWFVSRSSLLASAYDHTEDCLACDIPIRQLIGMIKGEALEEIARLDSAAGDDT
ncbi:hypothetical protein [Streptomyces sp. NPDC002265]|uniref:hypothetical protein n=1 Tax=Streptomyces sp. NPDC002265 TaxID=3154415 RepID=UPI003334772B